MTDHFELSIMIGHARNLRLGRDVVEEFRHRVLGVEHAFVHVHVDEVRATANLIEGDRRRLRVVPRANQARETRRSGDVRALADHLEVRIGPDRQRLEAREFCISMA